MKRLTHFSVFCRFFNFERLWRLNDIFPRLGRFELQSLSVGRGTVCRCNQQQGKISKSRWMPSIWTFLHGKEIRDSRGWTPYEWFFLLRKLSTTKMREKIVYYYLHPRIYFPKLLAVFDKKLVLRSFIEVSSFLLVASFQQTMGTTFSAVKTLNTSYTLIKFQARREPLHCRIRFRDGNRFFARFINSLWNQRSKPVLFTMQAHRDCSH